MAKELSPDDFEAEMRRRMADHCAGLVSELAALCRIDGKLADLTAERDELREACKEAAIELRHLVLNEPGCCCRATYTRLAMLDSVLAKHRTEDA